MLGQSPGVKAIFLLPIAGLLSALLSMCFVGLIGRPGVDLLVAGVIYGAALAGCLAILRVLRSPWKAVQLTLVTTAALFVGWLITVAVGFGPRTGSPQRSGLVHESRRSRLSDRPLCRGPGRAASWFRVTPFFLRGANSGLRLILLVPSCCLSWVARSLVLGGCSAHPLGPLCGSSSMRCILRAQPTFHGLTSMNSEKRSEHIRYSWFGRPAWPQR